MTQMRLVSAAICLFLTNELIQVYYCKPVYEVSSLIQTWNIVEKLDSQS